MKRKAHNTPTEKLRLPEGRMGHPARVDIAFLGGEIGIHQALEIPLVVEGHVCVLHVAHGLPVPEEQDFNLRRVETAHEAVEDVFFPRVGMSAGVHLHLRRLWRGGVRRQ